MVRFVKFAVVCCLALPAAPLLAASAKETDCAYQGNVVEAVRQARIARVRERSVPEHIAKTQPTWPEKYNAVIPLVAPWIYEMRMKEVRTTDLQAGWKELCLQQ
ncbi:hypothetical protein C1J03_07875 [Sulfitobacter sp. SK012]|uniref:hypothetical protein n=1 Tax=Sulfitobacter sp. SK012 TaxID=1389005 RepID=UPI000E0CAC9B|nr:hypothetical protein [Sulfitobacter sp. SK012]AXI45947.1 hypothetical protein C1J03_07875 [Sulfitobacter sp. SK012]